MLLISIWVSLILDFWISKKQTKKVGIKNHTLCDKDSKKSGTVIPFGSTFICLIPKPMFTTCCGWPWVTAMPQSEFWKVR
jgi:hypothetical protein